MGRMGEGQQAVPIDVVRDSMGMLRFAHPTHSGFVG